MSAGEYVSVSSQADSERADLAREKGELEADPVGEERELAGIYVKRGLDDELADRVARQLMAHDALQAHARDELGVSEETAARPIQAALASAASFAVGAALPLLMAILTPSADVILAVAATSLVFLMVLGAIGARVGGAPIWTAAVRVLFWGALAMGVTTGVGALFGTHGG